MIRVLIVEDHPAIGQGIRALLEDEPELQVVGVAADVQTATMLLRETDPDVVLCDVIMRGEDSGLELLRQSGGSRPRFLMFSAYAYPSIHEAAVASGAAGYLPKTATVEEIVNAIRAIKNGGRVLPSEVIRSARSARPIPSELERRTISLLATGATNAEIAATMSISAKTVESRLRRLFDRYDVVTRTELARLAEREGWLVGGGR